MPGLYCCSGIVQSLTIDCDCFSWTSKPTLGPSSTQRLRRRRRMSRFSTWSRPERLPSVNFILHAIIVMQTRSQCAHLVTLSKSCTEVCICIHSFICSWGYLVGDSASLLLTMLAYGCKFAVRLSVVFRPRRFCMRTHWHRFIPWAKAH